MLQSFRKLAGLAVIALCAVACASSHESGSRSQGVAAAVPDPKPPHLFQPGVVYELTNKDSKTTGYVFAEAGPKPNQQTVRWLLLDGFMSPVKEEVWVHSVHAADGTTLPKNAEEFAAFASKMFDPKGFTYVKSLADTHRLLRPLPTGDHRSVIPVPWPDPRPAPKPMGEERKAVAAATPAEAAPVADAGGGGEDGSYEQLDDGTIGIRPGGIVPAAGPGFLDPALLVPQGFVGLAVAGPMVKSNIEYWFLPGTLFDTGLDDTTLGPYRVMGGVVGMKPIADWAVVVISSSYYPNGVPEDY